MCLQVKNYKCLKETTHRRTYNLVRKDELAMCSRCKWHATFWRRCADHPFIYMVYEDDGTNKPYKQRFKHHLNWKLASKQPRQWMKKKWRQKVVTNFENEVTIYFGI